MYGNQPSRSNVGPLTPFQKPIVLAAYIGVGFLVTFFVGWLLLSSEWFEKRFRHSDQQSDEIAFRTVETSATAQDRLTTLHQELAQLDKDARKYFGDLHYWHDADSEPAPKQIYDFFHSLNDPNDRFLVLYEDLADSKLKLSALLKQLEIKVDESVSSLGDDATADAEFRSQRLLQNEISSAMDELDRQNRILNNLGQKYQANGGKPW